MSENEKNEKETKEFKCICKSEAVRKIAVIAIGTFIGVYASLSLFAALHRPNFHHHHHHFQPNQIIIYQEV